MRTVFTICLGFLSACFLEDNLEYCNQDNEKERCPAPSKPCNYAHHRCEDAAVIAQGGTPVVTGITPSSAKVGDMMTLQGQNFTSGMKALIGTTVVDTMLMSSTELVFPMPASTACSTLQIKAQTSGGDAVSGQAPLRYLLSSLRFTKRPSPVTIATNVTAMTAGLINADTDLDLAIVTGGMTLSLHKLLGPPPFSALSATGSVAYSDVMIKNMNNTGPVEIIARAANSIDIFQSPNYTDPPIQSITGSTAFSLVDYNKDGHQDIFVYNTAITQIAFAPSTGPLTYDAYAGAIGTSGSGKGLVVEDLDGDNQVDVFAGQDNGTVAYGLYQASGTWTLQQPLTVMNGTPDLMAVVDLNGSGQKALVVATRGGSGGSLYLGKVASATLDLPEITQIPPDAKFMMIEDMNCDNLKDIILYYDSGLIIEVYVNNGMGGFSTTPLRSDIKGQALAITPFTRASDGRQDMAVIRPGTGALDVLENSSE